LFRFVHAADLHLDTPFQAIVNDAPDIATALQNASLDAFDRLVQLTIDSGALFLIIAGDVYDGAERGVRAQIRFLDGLKALSAAGIETFICHGNHDPMNGWSAIRGEWPAGVHIFDHRQPESFPIVRNGVRIATIYGMSYPRRDVSENLSLQFHREDCPGLHIAVLHCNVGNNS
jgi:DNA repair protein SbcD/Mre11